MTQNAINNSASDLTIDPGASGDSFVQFDINTTGEFRIGVDDTDDSFRMSQGSALGTNDTFIMTAAGERTMPLQPAFSALIATSDLNRTGAGTFYTVGTNTAWTEIFDQNSDFNTNGTFTAPITGRYYLTASITVTGCTNASLFIVYIVTSNRIYPTINARPSSAANETTTLSCLADMDASDTATVQISVSGEAGDTVDILGDATNPWNAFSGYLVC